MDAVNRVERALLILLLSLTLVPRACLAQVDVQANRDKYGFLEPNPAEYYNGQLNIPCFQIAGMYGYDTSYRAQLQVTSVHYPIKFETTQVEQLYTCKGGARYSHNAVVSQMDGIVMLERAAGDAETATPYYYTLYLDRKNANGNFELSLYPFNLFRIVEAIDEVSSQDNLPLRIVPREFDQEHHYSLVDAYTHEQHNYRWNLQVKDDAVEVLPTITGSGDEILFDTTARTAQFLHYSFVKEVFSPIFALSGSFYPSLDYDMNLSAPYICDLPDCPYMAVGNISSTGALPSSWTFGKIRLKAKSQALRITSVTASDLNGVTTAWVEGLEAGTVIPQGQEVRFTLRSGFKANQQLILKWEIQAEGLGTIFLHTYKMKLDHQ